jgi:hypothetical protein
MVQISFEEMPKVLSALNDKIDKLESLVIANQSEPTDRWFDLNDLIDYLPERPAKATLYNKVQNRVIPFHRKGKKLFFLKSEIDEWLKEGRVRTKNEIKERASDYLAKKKGGSYA